jgi:hypothetical protein
MSFQRLSAHAVLRDQLVHSYRRRERLFPLIMAVLLNQQQGEVYTDGAAEPEAYFIEHRFGFSQLCGAPGPSFAEALAEHLFVAQDFPCAKIRCYCPDHGAFFLPFALRCQHSQRAQLRRPASTPLPPDHTRGACVAIDRTTADEVNEQLGLDLFCRFWGSGADFFRHAFGFAVRHAGRVVSACYSAAITEGIAEIDVATAGSARRQGFGRMAAAAFVRECQARGLTPSWDCFTNNPGSLGLAASLGFLPHGEPYDFVTIPRIR